ncbi:MAG: iron-containing alcohol dehydrogenase [Fimbriiglobus sp.]|nr:iron-containing alcohol dehydrogenase [Fimbriiglobus sp.]
MSAVWTFNTAGSLVFGRGAVAQLGDIAARLKAKRVLVVTDEVLVKVGIAEQAVAPLRAAGVEVSMFAGCKPEPPVEVIRDAADAARKFGPDLLIGLGGGSNMDAAKLVAVLLAHGGDPTDWVGDSRVPGPVFPLVCVPTTAGTGSEVSAAAVFTDTAAKMKVSTLSPYIRPAVAVVDPQLTDGCPKQVTADSGIDALTHAIEAYTAVDQAEFLQRPGGQTVYQGKNPLADLMASECIQLVGRFLRRAVNDLHDREARDGMALAATLGGLAFSNAGVALVHAMEYPVGGAVHVSHGAGNGLLLPYVMRWNREHDRGAFKALETLITIEGIERLRADIGIPTRLRDIGVTEDMLPTFAEKAFGIKRLMRVNPRVPQSAAEILDIYQAAF